MCAAAPLVLNPVGLTIVAVGTVAILTEPRWAPSLARALDDAFSPAIPDTDTATDTMAGRKHGGGGGGDDQEPCFDDTDIQQAQQHYPSKTGTQVHHRIPQFLGGSDDPSNLFPLPSAYHQLITNAWREQFGYQGDPWYYRPEDPQEIENFAKKLEQRYPLTKCD
jgi:hypothetical protein